jgi:hypothetical protein
VCSPKSQALGWREEEKNLIKRGGGGSGGGEDSEMERLCGGLDYGREGRRNRRENLVKGEQRLV